MGTHTLLRAGESLKLVFARAFKLYGMRLASMPYTQTEPAGRHGSWMPLSLFFSDGSSQTLEEPPRRVTKQGAADGGEVAMQTLSPVNASWVDLVFRHDVAIEEV